MQLTFQQLIPGIIGGLFYMLFQLLQVRLPRRTLDPPPRARTSPRPPPERRKAESDAALLEVLSEDSDSSQSSSQEPNPEPSPESDVARKPSKSVGARSTYTWIVAMVSILVVAAVCFYSMRIFQLRQGSVMLPADEIAKDMAVGADSTELESDLDLMLEAVPTSSAGPQASVAIEKVAADTLVEDDDAGEHEKAYEDENHYDESELEHKRATLDVSDSTGALGAEEEVEGEMGRVVTLALQKQSTKIDMQDDVIYYKSAYYGTISVGTPAVPFKVVFDTGSGMLVLPSSYCRSDTCRAHQRYRRSASETGMDVDHDGSPVEADGPRDQIQVSFGTGEVEGVFVEDQVCFGDIFAGLAPAEKVSNGSSGSNEHADQPRRTCTNFRMITATDMSDDPFYGFEFDGILGLGLESLAQTPEMSFLNVLSQTVEGWGGTRHHTFGVFLAEEGVKEEESAITFGGWAKDKVEGKLSWNKVHEPEHGHWLLRVKGIYVDDHPVKFCEDGNCNAVFDTGTSLISVPNAAFPEMFMQLRHLADESGGCEGVSPKLHFDFENARMTLEPKDYARLEDPKPQSSKVWPKFTTNSNNETELSRNIYCKPKLMTMDMPEPIGPKLFILGEPVLRKYYTVYDARPEGARIGIALAAHVEAGLVSVSASEDESWFEEATTERDDKDGGDDTDDD